MMERPGKHRANDGDWICTDPSCANLNFARRTVCNRCNKEKGVIPKKKLGQEIGKSAAEKSKGLFSADDWLCNKCCNINWARRQQCNMCNAPKFGDVEERTGYGGGYNDRGVVEYIKRDDSDDDYDEFGRKKKRKTDMSSSSDEESDEHDEVNQRNVKEINGRCIADEEEENDEEEDEDLSKYDLTEWEVEAKEHNPEDRNYKEDTSKQKHRHRSDRKSENSKQRSRSRSPF